MLLGGWAAAPATPESGPYTADGLIDLNNKQNRFEGKEKNGRGKIGESLRFRKGK
jgi:hypothetical protein